MLEPGIILAGVNYVKAIDGDTIEFSLTRNFRIRVRDIDCPERSTEKGIEALEFVDDLFCSIFDSEIRIFIPTNNPIKLIDFLSFERIVGDIYLKDNNLAEILKEHGYEKHKHSSTD